MHDSDEMVHVVLSSIPSALFLRVQHHIDELVRELELVALGITPEHPLADLRLLPLLDGPLSDFRAVREAATAQATEAERLGQQRVQIDAVLPRGSVAAVLALTEALEQADEVAASAALLTLPATPEMAELRRWMTDEVVRQIDEGTEPRRCPLGDDAV